MTALLTARGCGKSTLPHLLGGLDRTVLDETRLTGGTTGSLSRLAGLETEG
jgi:ABC-type lipoprotein export system ATPase subunit